MCQSKLSLENNNKNLTKMNFSCFIVPYKQKLDHYNSDLWFSDKHRIMIFRPMQLIFENITGSSLRQLCKYRSHAITYVNNDFTLVDH